MYPFIRLIKETWKFRSAPELPIFGEHVSHHICWPQDIDFWVELNNGRTLTLYDLGRIPLARRTGLLNVLRKNSWGLTVAGSSVRYRRRVRPFQRVEMRSRLAGMDGRFFYVEQSMWRAAECTSHALYRMAVTDQNGIVAAPKVLSAMGRTQIMPVLPDWITAWCDAENLRPWPPMQEPIEGAAANSVHSIPQRNDETAA